MGSNLYAREIIERKLAALRAELAGPHPTPLEILIVERIAACWLHMHHADMLFVGNASQSEAVRKELLKRQESAQRQYFAAVKLLAQVRKLLQRSSRAKSAKVVDSLAGQLADAAQALESHDSKLGVFSSAGVDEACEDPSVHRGQEIESHAASAVLEFPRMSKEHEADATRNGVGIMN